MSPQSETPTRPAPEAELSSRPNRLARFSEGELSQMRDRLDAIRRQPHPGKLARKLRKRKEISVEEMGDYLGVDPDMVSMFEKSGAIRIWSELAEMRSCFSDCEPEEPTEDLLGLLIELLEPSPEEEAVLRHDITDDLNWLAVSVKRLLPEDLWKELAERPPSDPWDEKTAPKTKRRSRSKAEALSTLSALAPAGRTSDSSHGLPEPEKPDEVLGFVVQLTALDPEGRAVRTTDLARFVKGFEQLEELGLSLSESKEILAELQKAMVQDQADAYLQKRQRCTACDRVQGIKGSREVTLRTLFGNVSIQSPRFRRCRCQAPQPATFSPLKDLLTAKTSPELLFMEAKWSALVSYGLSTKALQEFLPVDKKLSPSTVRCHALAVARRLESELGEERTFFVEGCPRDWEELPDAPGPITVGIDGGYLRRWHDRKKNFEVIVGKSVPTEGRSKCFGLVQTRDQKPKRRLFNLLRSQGMQMNQKVFFLSDGEQAVRQLQQYLNPQAEHILDWFHITMRITVLKQFVKGLVRLEKAEGAYAYDSPAREMQSAIDSTKWKLWHGKVSDALERLQDLETLMYNFEESYPKFDKLERAVEEFLRYLERNRGLLRNYGQDRREGRPISTAFIESLVNSLLTKRFSKKQQMQWTPDGARLLLQNRTKVFNQELPRIFNRWYSKLNLETEGHPRLTPLAEVA